MYIPNQTHPPQLHNSMCQTELLPTYTLLSRQPLFQLITWKRKPACHQKFATSALEDPQGAKVLGLASELASLSPTLQTLHTEATLQSQSRTMAKMGGGKSTSYRHTSVITNSPTGMEIGAPHLSTGTTDHKLSRSIGIFAQMLGGHDCPPRKRGRLCLALSSHRQEMKSRRCPGPSQEWTKSPFRSGGRNILASPKSSPEQSRGSISTTANSFSSRYRIRFPTSPCLTEI